MKAVIMREGNLRLSKIRGGPYHLEHRMKGWLFYSWIHIKSFHSTEAAYFAFMNTREKLLCQTS